MEAEKKLTDFLREKGFRAVKGVPDIEDATEYSAALEILKEVSRTALPQKLYLKRRVHFKNEWHDEHLTQFQAFIIQERVGLGTVRRLAEDGIRACYEGQDVEVTVKSEYIGSVVPGVELLADGKNVAGGGFIRDDAMEAAGLRGSQAVTVTFVAERF